MNDYGSVVEQQQQSQAQGFSGSSQSPAQQPSLHEQFRGLQTSLANTIGNAAEAASKAGLPQQSAQEIVNRAYRQAW